MVTEAIGQAAGPDADALRRAVADAKNALADLPEDLSGASRDAAFLRLLDARLGRLEGAGGADSDAEDLASQRARRVCSIARYLEIEEPDVHDLFKVDGPIPILVFPAAKLQDDAAAAVRQIALVSAAARTAIDMATSTLDVRDAAERYGKLDDGFARAVEAVPGIELHGRPGARSRRIRLLENGLDEARRTARDLLG